MSTRFDVSYNLRLNVGSKLIFRPNMAIYFCQNIFGFDCICLIVILEKWDQTKSMRGGACGGGRSSMELESTFARLDWDIYYFSINLVLNLVESTVLLLVLASRKYENCSLRINIMRARVKEYSSTNR